MAYENKLEKTNELFIELSEWMMCLQEREREIIEYVEHFFLS